MIIHIVFIIFVVMFNTIDKLERQKLLKFAQTKPNYKSKIFKLLGASNFSQKMLYSIGMKKIEFSTTKELFHELIIVSLPRSYDSNSIMHENKIGELQLDYEKFRSFSQQFNYTNLEIDDKHVDFSKLDRLQSKRFSAHAMKRTLEQLKMYPLPFDDVFDIIEIILDIGRKQGFSGDEKSYVMENFIKNKIENLYRLGLDNPGKRNELIENIKTQYRKLENANDVAIMSLDIPQ